MIGITIFDIEKNYKYLKKFDIVITIVVAVI